MDTSGLGHEWPLVEAGWAISGVVLHDMHIPSNSSVEG